MLWIFVLFNMTGVWPHGRLVVIIAPFFSHCLSDFVRMFHTLCMLPYFFVCFIRLLTHFLLGVTNMYLITLIGRVPLLHSLAPVISNLLGFKIVDC